MLHCLPRLMAFGLCSLLFETCIALAEDDSRPWPPTYKIRPHETDKLTAADVAGSEGRLRLGPHAVSHSKP